VLGIQGTMKTSATLSITAPVVIMTLPMLDVVAAVIRRKLGGRRLASPDREHIHHLLLDRGLSPWQVLCILGAFCLTTGAAATAATVFRKDALAWITALTLVVLLIRFKLFGHREFTLLRREIRRRRFILGQNLARIVPPLRSVDKTASSRSLQKLWNELLREVEPWAPARLELIVRGRAITGKRCWIDPAKGDVKKYFWAVGASFGKNQDWQCEIQVDCPQRARSEKQQLYLVKLLRKYLDLIGEQVQEPQVLSFLDKIQLISTETQQTVRKAA
ncbi:MAG: hypothetical protein ACWGMZ_11990, partial [Thermoguttaceae bacterium]